MTPDAGGSWNVGAYPNPYQQQQTVQQAQEEYTQTAQSTPKCTYDPTDGTITTVVTTTTTTTTKRYVGSPQAANMDQPTLTNGSTIDTTTTAAAESSADPGAVVIAQPEPKAFTKKAPKQSTSGFQGPFMMANLGVPKNALTAWYGKRYKNDGKVSNKAFITWSNNAPTHLLRFTSVFKCPVTGEYFASGRFGVDKPYEVTEEICAIPAGQQQGLKVEVIWYSKKMKAEHAAAARALDCLSYREGNGNIVKCYSLCEEKPYLDPTEAPLLPSSIPDTLYNEVMKNNSASAEATETSTESKKMKMNETGSTVDDDTTAKMEIAELE